jgi:alkylation response protein AidB-like acyl-CoA dehydrogenase
METLINDVKNFVNRTVLPSVEYFDKNNIYPTELIEIMKSMGLFGLIIPKMYGGLELDFFTRLQVVVELSSGWVSLCSILDSHLRVCDYIIHFGNQQQKEKYLPLLAEGKLIASHAHNEKNQKILENFETCLTSADDSLEKWILSGRKEWITNSRNADIYAVSARLVGQHEKLKSINSCVALVEKNTIGLKIEKDWDRMGVKGISLAPVVLKNCLIETKNIIGEFHHNGKTLVESSHRNLSMISSARAIGISNRLIEKYSFYLLKRNRNGIIGSLAEEPVIRFRLGQLVTKFHAAQSLFNDCCSNLDSIDRTKFIACKIFVTETSKDICLSCLQLFGGSGYTSEYNIDRYVRDALALSIIHTPTDISLTRLGQLTLEDFKLKEQNTSSIVLKYAPIVLPHIERRFLVEATLGEHEKIINAGFYRNTNIRLFLYDMTTMSPSRTFKDFLGCITFAHCLKNNIKCICAQSSGNTAMSLIHYARKNPSIKLIQFYLTRNSYKINSTFVPDNVTLVEVNSTEAEMKRILKRFVDLTNIPNMPNLSIQFEANQIRAYFLKDYWIENEIYFNWYVQSVSSAFGPIGLYKGFTDIGQEQVPIPKFLGIQQEAVCPFACALGYWNNDPNETDKQVELIEPTLFRSDPGELVNRVKHIIDTYGGKIKVLTNDNFNKYLDEAISILSKNNIHITKTVDGTILEKSGILAVAATLHEIDIDDHGIFSENENILIGITGGTGCPATQKPKPKLLFNENPTDEQLKLILEYI